MNDNQRIHLEYGRKMLVGKRMAQDECKYGWGHEDKKFGAWLVNEGLDIDPVTDKKAHRNVRSACIWAAENPETFKQCVRKYPRVPTVFGLYRAHKEELSGADDTPCVYVYRMLGPVSGELLEPQICKIGSTTGRVSQRVADQSKKAAVGYIAQIELVLKCKKPTTLEKLLHEMFKDRQVDVPGREWFEVSPEQVEKAVQELESDNKLWRDDEWVHIGCKPKTPVKKRKKRSKDKTAAYRIYKIVLPNLEMMTDDQSSIKALSQRTGLEPDAVRGGLQWLVKAGYLQKFEGGQLTPSAKFYESHSRKKSKKAG